MNDQVESNEGIYSPAGTPKIHIDSLPLEILGRILGQHLNYTRDDPVNDPDRLVPLEVCRIWRDTALSDPACWTKLEIVISMKSSPLALDRRLRHQFSHV